MLVNSLIYLNLFLGIVIIYNINRKYELLIILSLVIIIHYIFKSNNIFYFYVLFEITLPLLFFLISIYGSNNRIRASYYIFIYTLLGSLFLLVGIVLYAYTTNNIYFSDFSEINNVYLEIFIYVLMFIGFLIKIPLFPFHIWLSFAHSEAPASGSMILAGIILKLAVFGIIFFLINLLPNAHLLCAPYISWLCIFTLFYVTAVTIVQTDTKVIVAYSSIAHMAIIILGLISNSLFGFVGAMILSLAHGLASPGLFSLVGDSLYKIFHSRSLAIVRGVLQYTPVLASFLFLFSLANISFPITFNFLGEFLCLFGLRTNTLILTLSCFTILFSALITFNLLTKILFRDNYNINPSYIITQTQYNLMFSLLAPILIFGIYNQNLFYNLAFDSLNYIY